MVNITIAQYATSNGVLLKLSLDQAAAVIVYARDDNTGKIYDLKEVLSEETVHYVSLSIPTNHGTTMIVARAIQ